MSRRVLMVDDDTSVASSLGEVLLSEGYDVVYAANGQIDIVSLDQCMPVRGGWDTFEGLTAFNPVVPNVGDHRPHRPISSHPGELGKGAKRTNVPSFDRRSFA